MLFRSLIQANNPEQIKGILRAESNLNAYGDIKVLSIEEIVYSITPKLIIEKYYENYFQKRGKRYALYVVGYAD